MKAREIAVGGYLRTPAGTVCRVGRPAKPYLRVTWWRNGVRLDGFIRPDEDVAGATREEWLVSARAGR